MPESICIRIKRKKQTFFITSSKSSSISSIKSQISEALSCCSDDDNVIPEKMRLYKDASKILPDDTALGDHDSINDGSELYLVLKEEGDCWESIDVAESEL
eukprot:scaffold1621_cov262-Chaetoceros_neogracile.AAC.18